MFHVIILYRVYLWKPIAIAYSMSMLNFLYAVCRIAIMFGWPLQRFKPTSNVNRTGNCWSGERCKTQCWMIGIRPTMFQYHEQAVGTLSKLDDEGAAQPPAQTPRRYPPVRHAEDLRRSQMCLM